MSKLGILRNSGTNDELKSLLRSAGFNEQTFFLVPDESAWRVHRRKRWLAHHLPITGKLRSYVPWQTWDRNVLRMGITRKPLTVDDFSLSENKNNRAIDLLVLASSVLTID